MKYFLINEAIRADNLRVIDADGQQLGVMPRSQALNLAKEKGLDLVLVAADEKAPVCKIADFGKMKYEILKQEKEARKKQKNTSMKELSLSAKIGEHDYKVVLRKSIDFLTKGHRVKIALRFKGREVTHPEIGSRMLQRLISDVSACGIAENQPKLEGKLYWMMLVPK